MSNGFANLGLADYQQQFVDALEFIDNVIQSRELVRPRVWVSTMPRGAHPLGQGLSRGLYRFRPGLTDQAGLDTWDPIQISRQADGSDPGIDACGYDPVLIDYGFEKINWTGFQTSRRTKHLCIRDVRFSWEFEQQIEKIFGFLGDATMDVWEVYAREQYLASAADNSRAYVLTDGAFNGTTFSYDPFTPDGDGENVLTFNSGTAVSTLNWEYLRKFARFLQWDAPGGQAAVENGQPLFTLVMDLEDWDQMKDKDSAIREDFRFAQPSINIENFGMVTNYKGFLLVHDLAAPHWTMKSDNGTTITLRRVNPHTISAAGTTGVQADANAGYVNAEFGIAAIKLNEVFQIDVPPAGPPAPGGGTSFGSTPSLNGEFSWINIPDEEKNLLGEVGFYFARFEAFKHPLELDDKAVVFLYRRCTQTTRAECDIGGDDALSSPVSYSSAAAVSGSTVAVQITASGIADREASESVTITPTSGSDLTGVISDSSQAPIYTIIFQTAADATTAAGTATGSMSW